MFYFGVCNLFLVLMLCGCGYFNTEVVDYNSETPSDPPPSFWIDKTLLSGYWKLNETGAPTSFSDEEDANDGSCSNCPVPTVGLDNGAMDFTAANSETIDLGLDPAFDFTTGDMTVATWVNTTEAGGITGAVSKWDRPVNRQYWLGKFSSNVARFIVDSCCGANTTLDGTTVINDGNWHLIVGVYKAGVSVELYVDGNLEDGQYFPVTMTSQPTTPLLIGGSVGEFYWDGAVDEVSIWSRALSATEISELFTRQVLD